MRLTWKFESYEIRWLHSWRNPSFVCEGVSLRRLYSMYSRYCVLSIILWIFPCGWFEKDRFVSETNNAGVMVKYFQWLFQAVADISNQDHSEWSVRHLAYWTMSLWLDFRYQLVYRGQCVRALVCATVAFLILIFQKVVWRRVWGMVGSLMIVSLQIYCWVCEWKNFVNRPIHTKYNY